MLTGGSGTIPFHQDPYSYSSNDMMIEDAEFGLGMKAFDSDGIHWKEYSYLKGSDSRTWSDPDFLVNLLGIDVLRCINHLQPLGADIVSYYLTLCNECVMWLRAFRACRAQNETSLYPVDIFIPTPDGYVDVSPTTKSMKPSDIYVGSKPVSGVQKEMNSAKEATLNSAKVDTSRKALVRWFTKNNLWKKQHQERCNALKELGRRVLPVVKVDSQSEGVIGGGFNHADYVLPKTGSNNIIQKKKPDIRQINTLPNFHYRTPGSEQTMVNSPTINSAGHFHNLGGAFKEVLGSAPRGGTASRKRPGVRRRGSLRDDSSQSMNGEGGFRAAGGSRGCLASHHPAAPSNAFGSQGVNSTGYLGSQGSAGANSMTMLFCDSKNKISALDDDPLESTRPSDKSSQRTNARRYDEVVVACSDSNEKRLRCLYQWLEKESRALKIIEIALFRLKSKPQHKNSEWRDDSFSVIAQVRDLCPGLQLEMPLIRNYLMKAGYPQYSEVIKAKHYLDRRKGRQGEIKKANSLEEGGDISYYADMGLYAGLIKQVQDGKELKTIFEPFPWFSFDPRSDSSSYSAIDDALIFRDAPIPNNR